ncbi:DUF3999 domain-containing protein [Collimonas sp.]|jgi:hypothetical protein|uniref:DUF3999 domain-containing protein n=1 Tax=Collimonas sp. TaxID=1963772 RepID=UPI002C97443C|nr:DUF3999 domain-containing protein [Collimonas sp.]HWW05848.1 DUF3999 domain-containing protein [Collimonas sp.]
MNYFPMRAAICACVLAVSGAAWPAADPNNTQSYALHLPLTFNADAPLQRLILPAQVMVNMQSGGMRDLRIFNAQGQPLALALSDSASLRQTENRKIELKSSPIMGSADVTDISASSLRIEEQQGRRIVQIDSSAADAGAPRKKVLGALLDTRAIADPVVALALDVDLPDAQPVTFDLQASKDLKDWRSLTQAVLYRAAAGASALGADHIELPAVNLEDQYLRVIWTDAARKTAPVVMRSATLTTARGVNSIARVSAALARPLLNNPYELRFSLPFATPVAALKIKPAGDNVLLPVRVLGRNDPSQPWSMMAASVVYKLQSAGKLQTSAAIELPPTAFREIKIEADKKTPGFSAPPEIILEFEPVQVVALVNGAAPYTLAAGLANAANPYLPVQSLMPDYRAAQENGLPLATVDGAAALVPATASRDGMPTRSIILWAVLLLAALALGAMAWVLFKQNSKPSGE